MGLGLVKRSKQGLDLDKQKDEAKYIEEMK